MERLSKGETHLNSASLDGLLREADPDLNIERLRKLKMLSKKMAELSRERLGRIGYRHEKDVRAVPCWPDEKPVLLITGESGAGKTWQLGKYLKECVGTHRTATLVIARTTEDVLKRAARDIWQSGLGDTSEKSLIAVSNYLHKIAPNIPIPLLTVAVDDIQDIDVARDLIRQDWMDWGMRLILTVPHTVARGLERTDSENIHVHHISDFSVNELDTLLKQHGQQWADLPSDLKKLLCKPILAGLFLELRYTSFQDAPCSEYEIFEKFWARITANSYDGDAGIVIALAAHTHEGKSYPLPRPEWQGIGLTDESLARLQSAGWLRSQNGEVEFVHDRLLNWAVAKSLARKFQLGELSVDDLYDTLVVKRKEQEGRLSQRLGYVLMDTFWLLAAEDTHSRALGQFVEKMDDYTLRNYIHLLPTLGQRSVPILLELLNRITSDSSCGYKVSLIRKALVNIARQEKIELGDEITELLNTSYRFQQSVAIAVLEAVPDPRHLDRLWELHQQYRDARDNNTDGYKIRDYQASFAALRAGIKLNPEWLRNRILDADNNRERISELGYLLSGLEHSDAPAIWRDTSDVLMSNISQNKPRSLINCIARFGDHEKIDFVIEHLSCSEDSASWAAIEALTILAPQEAVDRLIEVEDFDRYVTRNQWLPHLLRVRPIQTRQRILELARSVPRGYKLIADIFWERPDELDEATLRFVLRTLETDLRDLRESFAEEPFILDNPLEFLGRVACPKLLKILQAEADSELERLIVEVAFSRLHTNSCDFNYILENARRILILIGGQGITTLINRELESEHFWVRYGGLKWAFVRADDCTIKQLAAIARRPLPRDANGQPESGLLPRIRQAMTVLAALGADSVLVEILMQTDVVDVSIPVDYLADLRAHCGPIPTALTDSAIHILQDAASPEDLQLTSLVITWLSGDADLIPTVRTVLERADPESQIAKYACIALQQLGDQSDDFARLAKHLAQTNENATQGLNALVGLGNRGLEPLQNWIQSQNATNVTEDINWVISTLYRDAKTRQFAVDNAVSRCLNGGFTHYPLYDIAAESDNPDLRRQILDVAFAEHSHVIMEPLRAIQGLAKFDVARAIEAIERGLRFHPKIERDLCLLLVRIAPETAAEKLLDTITSIERKSLIPVVGRALRRLDPTIVAPSVVKQMSISSSRRELVAELAGWLPIPEVTEALGHLAEHDRSINVRHVALAALEYQRREKMVCALLEGFPIAMPKHQWALLVAILEVADPYLLTDREDPLWIGQIFKEDVPYAFIHHAKKMIKEQKRKVMLEEQKRNED